jgi:predicted transcriptional regulator
MLLSDARKALGIPNEDVISTRSSLRKYYLKAALNSHPDKNLDDSTSNIKFASLQEAYRVLLAHVEANLGQHLPDDEIASCSDHDLSELLKRAFQGENVDRELERLGVHRPSPLFGIDMHVCFHESSASNQNRMRSSKKSCTLVVDEVDNLQSIENRQKVGNVDIKTVLVDAFHQDLLDEEGNPLEGWSRPPGDEDGY